MRLADRRFAPSVFATVLLLAGVAAFVLLGRWQLDRAEEKRALIEQYSAGDRTTLDLTQETAAQIPLYQHVRLAGRFDASKQILLDNMPSQHQGAGYRVVTPFALEGGGSILVDRGWVPLGASRDQLPTVDVPTDSRHIEGRFDALPRPGIALDTATPDSSAGWPRVMNFPRQADIEAALGHGLVPGLVLLDSDQRDGYQREWQARLQFNPDRHIAYAVQWFGLAMAAVVIYVIVSFRRKQIDE